MTGQEKGDL